MESNAGEGADADDRMKEWENLRAEIANHPGTVASRLWSSLQMVHGSLMDNEAALLAHLRQPEFDEDMAIAVLQQDQVEGAQELFFRGVFRHLQNYVAMRGTLVDHTRNLVGGYPSSDFADEYEQRIAGLRSSGAGLVLQGLRNYLLHRNVPPMAIQVKWSSGEPGALFAVKLTTEELLKWDNWHSGARKYLKNVDGDLGITELVVEYGNSIEDLYRWMYEQFPILHAADIRDRNRLAQFSNNFWRETST